MIEEIRKLLEKYRNKGILIDTNLLLMYLIGATINPDFIHRFKRTQKYVREDYDILNNLIRYFKRVITTPNIFTEVSNLTNSLEYKYKVLFTEIFAKNILLLDEHYLESKKAAGTSEFHKFGITDAVIFYVVSHKYLLLTDDLP